MKETWIFLFSLGILYFFSIPIASYTARKDKDRSY
tara:strand:+ start:131 stop:235 length:105 start_codon:yes stop_codon:yes gene_type:complete